MRQKLEKKTIFLPIQFPDTVLSAQNVPKQ